MQRKMMEDVKMLKNLQMCGEIVDVVVRKNVKNIFL